MSDNVPVLRRTQDIALLTDQQLALLKKTYAPTATDEEFDFYLQVARATDLNPFTQPQEIYFYKIKGKPVMPVGIDGLRRQAAESGEYAGQAGPFWCGPDAVWRDLWISDGPPFAAKVGIYRYGPDGKVNPTPTWGVVKWSEFAKDVTQPVGKFWKNMGAHMLAKCAESQAFRKACPGLTKKMQAAGAQVIDAEYLIYKAEQIERQRALPQHTPPGDLQQELYGQGRPSDGDRQVINGEFEEGESAGGPGSSETEGEGDGDKKKGPVKWTKKDLARLQQAVSERELSSKEWRQMLGLTETAEVKDVVALGTVGHVIDLLQAAFTEAVAGEPPEQSKLGF